MNSDLLNKIQAVFSGKKHGEKIQSVKNISGGCINECYSFLCGNEKYFLKINHAGDYPGLFEAEVAGLEALSGKSSLIIPTPITVGTAGHQQFLIMEFLGQESALKDYSELLGRGLAQLHKNTNSYFGFHRDNYIASLPQKNFFMNSFSEFFVQARLEPQLQSAIENGLMTKKDSAGFKILFSKLKALIPEERPSLLHGDLWNGNVMPSVKGPAIFDPAVYFGHRETDLAMTTLFGGFDSRFYSAYNEEFKLEKGWKERLDIYNLYPLLVHVNLFGGNYAQEVRTVLKKFI
jgi:protein-ribulosamine 3-kinase